jgi:hypothetical protein
LKDAELAWGIGLPMWACRRQGDRDLRFHDDRHGSSVSRLAAIELKFDPTSGEKRRFGPIAMGASAQMRMESSDGTPTKKKSQLPAPPLRSASVKISAQT